jgi:hypothetical protein
MFLQLLTLVAIAAGDPASIPVPVFSSAPTMTGKIDESWQTASRLTLDRDFTNRRRSDEPTIVYVAQDGTSLYVAFDVTQREPIIESTETNGASVAADDYVGVLLSPNGPLGFQYAFYANPRGARYQTSSENSAYTPQWTAIGRRTTHGYSIVLRIPLDVIRNGKAVNWRVQFERSTVYANALDVWTTDERAENANDATYFGTLQKIGFDSPTAARTKPRAQVYGLAEGTNRADGGNTSRVGVDLSLPVAATTSVVASLHPDYSNVEIDQQTISPTAFPRQFSEVRPFFTQVGSSFNYAVASFNSPLLLYTPAIPTFRDGYALEGTQGPFTYAGFDAIGQQRIDQAEAVDYNLSTPDRSVGLDVQNVAVDSSIDGIHDAVTSLQGGFVNNHSHALVFLNYAQEAGATVSDTSLGKYFEAGVGYSTATTLAAIYYEGIGPQFAPADAYVQQNNIYGFNGIASQKWPFHKQSVLHDINFSASAASLRTRQGIPSQDDAQTDINFDFSNLFTFHAFYSQSAVRTYSNEFLPFDGNGFLAGYKVSTATPTYITYQGGPYFHGSLDAWTYLATLPLAPHVHLTLEVDEDQYLSTYIDEERTNLWLERPTLDVQFNRELQLDAGVRRIVGSYLPTYNSPPTFTPVSGGNVSVAVHYLARDGRSEVYAVYGDPNSFATTPALFLKYIRYFGAPKGS